MEFRDIFHDPADRVVASGAIIPDSLLMYVVMAGHTRAFGLFKLQGLMTGAAVQVGMTPGQGKFRAVMRKGRFFGYVRPIVGMMAQGTIQYKIAPVR